MHFMERVNDKFPHFQLHELCNVLHFLAFTFFREKCM